MWALIGEEPNIYQDDIGGDFKEHRTKKIVALFSTEEKAEAYLKKNLLENPVYKSFSGWHRFRDDSLLADCDEARIEAYVLPDYPVDPE